MHTLHAQPFSGSGSTCGGGSGVLGVVAGVVCTVCKGERAQLESKKLPERMPTSMGSVMSTSLDCSFSPPCGEGKIGIPVKLVPFFGERRVEIAENSSSCG